MPPVQAWDCPDSRKPESSCPLFPKPGVHIRGMPEVMTQLGKAGESCKADGGSQASVPQSFSLRLGD